MAKEKATDKMSVAFLWTGQGFAPCRGWIQTNIGASVYESRITAHESPYIQLVFYPLGHLPFSVYLFRHLPYQFSKNNKYPPAEPGVYSGKINFVV